MSRFLLVLLSLIAFAAPVRAQRTPEAVVDSLMAAYNKPGSPGGVVAVIRNGAVAFAKGYGEANLAYGRPNTPETVFNIGSVSKQFTGFFFATLAEQGRLSLDDDVRKYLPELPNFGPVVTLRHLLNHTSGYREAYGMLYLQGRRVDGDILTRQDAIEVVRRQPALQFAPGTRHLYNSTAYVLLTEIAERITGQPFPDWMEANVFGPLGMNATEIEREAGDVIPNAARSYTRNLRGSYREAFEAYNYYGATDIYTTAGDLAKWMSNLGSSRLGGPGVMRRMTEHSVFPDGDTLTYTLGLVVDQHLGLRRYQHTGSTGGYLTYFAYYPALDAGVVVMGNVNSVPITPIGEATASAFFNRPAALVPTPSSVQVAYDRLQALAGIYRLPGLGVGRFAVGTGTLTLSTGGSPVPLVALNDSTFALRTQTFRFSPATGGVWYVDPGSGRVLMERLAPVPASLDLAAYTGRYMSEEAEATVTVSEVNGALVVTQRRLGPKPLRAVGRDVFSGENPFGEVAFERDRAGTVTGFVVSTGRSYGIRFTRMN